MGLQDIVKDKKELSESVLVLALNNGFSIGLEREQSDDSESRDIKFAVLNNVSGMSDLPAGDNARFVSSGDYASFSGEAKRMLDGHAAKLMDPLVSVRTQMGEAYDEILAPVDIQPVHKRNLGRSLSVIGMTLTYPVSAPLIYLYYRVRGVRDIDGINILLPVLTIPFQFPDAVRELVSPSVKGVRITNKKVFSERPEGENYVGVTGLGEELNPDFFGDSTSLNGRKAYLQVVFPDGLELSGDHAFYPVNGNHYSSAKHFLPIDNGLGVRVYSLKDQEKEIYRGLRDFSDGIEPQEVAATLKALNVLN